MKVYPKCGQVVCLHRGISSWILLFALFISPPKCLFLMLEQEIILCSCSWGIPVYGLKHGRSLPKCVGTIHFMGKHSNTWHPTCSMKPLVCFISGWVRATKEKQKWEPVYKSSRFLLRRLGERSVERCSCFTCSSLALNQLSEMFFHGAAFKREARETMHHGCNFIWILIADICNIGKNWKKHRLFFGWCLN